MFRKFVAMTICVSICALALGCGGSGGEGGGNDEIGKKAIDDAVKAMAEKKAKEEKGQ